MSAREKFLIVILASVVIVLGGFKLLIEPKLKSVSDTSNALAEARAELQQYNDNLKTAQTVSAANEQLLQKAGERAEPFFPELKSDIVQVFFQGLANKAGIGFSSFTMTEKTFTQIGTAAAPQASDAYPIKEAADGARDTGGARSASSAPPAGKQKDKAKSANAPDVVEMMTVTMQFSADYARSVSFLEQVKNCGRTVNITGVNMTTGAGGALTVNVTVSCYGIAKLSKDALSTTDLSPAGGKANPFQ